jgi:uncharacterized membrane protein YedE/YeeE
MMTYTVALSAFLSGVYYDWRLCLVGIFILMGGILNVVLSNTAPLLMWMSLGVAILYFAGAWGYSRWQAWRVSRSEI